MRKLIYILPLLFLSFIGFSQPWAYRSSNAITAADYRLKAINNFYLPWATDTTLNGGLDSLGALLLVIKTGDTSLYMRTPRAGGNKWTKMLKSGDAAGGVLSFNTRTGSVTLTSGDITTALGYTPPNPNGTNLQYIAGDGSKVTFPTIPAQFNPINGYGITITGTYPNKTFTADTATLFPALRATISGGGGGGIGSLNGLTAGTQTFSIGTSGTNFNIQSAGSNHAFNIPVTSGTNTGLVNPTLFNTWNAKISNITGLVTAGTNVTITGSGTSGSPYVINSSGSGSGVTSVATNNGTGITGGAITSTGTLALDTTNIVSTKAYRKKGDDSLGAIIAGKQGTLTLTTTGSSGASTLIGNTLNIPQYTGGGGGGADSTFQKLNWVSVDSFGARGDGLSDTTGNITSGSNIFTSPNAAFTSADIGKYFAVGGAGASGAELVTTIAGFTNSTTVTLTANAGTTVTNANYKYGTDNTVAIQNAINFAHSTYQASTVYFRSGRYFINGAPVTNVGGSNPNSQLYIPRSNYSPSAYQKSIRLLGANPPNLFIDFAVKQTPPNAGTIIESLRTDSAAAVLGTVPDTALYGTFNWTMAYLENMQIRTKSNNQVSDIKPLMTGIDFSLQNFCDLKNVRVETNSATQSSVKPDSSTYGIYLPIINNGGNNHLDNVMVQGFFNGIAINENTNGDNITIAASWIAMRFDSSYHTSNWNRVLIVWCPYKIRVTAQAYFNITQLDIEHYNAAGPVWFRDSLDLDEAHAGVSKAQINVFIQEAFSGDVTKYFSRNGNFFTSGISVLPIGFGLSYYAPGGSNAQYRIGGGKAGSNDLSVGLSGGPANQITLDYMRGATKVLSTGIGLASISADDYFQYDQVRGKIDYYVDPNGNIGFGGPQAHINPQLFLNRTNNSVTMSANDTVQGALFVDSSMFSFIRSGNYPMMHWHSNYATLGQRDYYQFIDDGHMYWETVDNGGTPHIFLQETQSAGVPLYTTIPIGNLGINVAVPTERLEVGGNAVFTQAKITNSVSWSKPIELGVETTLPAISMHYAGGPTDQKNWDWYFDGTNLVLRSVDDGITSTENAYEIKRSGVNIASVSFPSTKVGIGNNTPDSVLNVTGSGHFTGTLRINALPSSAGTKAVRYNPSTGNLSYADTTTGGGGGDTLKVVNAGSGTQIGYILTPDTLALKSLKLDNGLTLTTNSDSTLHGVLGGNLTGNTTLTLGSNNLIFTGTSTGLFKLNGTKPGISGYTLLVHNTDSSVAQIPLSTLFTDANVTSGTYTPTITNGANVASSTGRKTHWHRIGDEVFVEGTVDVTATAGATITAFNISLPTGISTFGSVYDLSGHMGVTASTGTSGGISADTGSGNASVSYYAPGTATFSIGFSFSYTYVAP
jgi:hypothetical protein